MGQLLHQQGARHPAAQLLGHDVCLRAQRQLRGLRVSRGPEPWCSGADGGCVQGPGQHLQHLQPQDQGGQRAGVQRAARTHRVIINYILWGYCVQNIHI